MTVKDLELWLGGVLGPSYGGPCLSLEGGEFKIFTWTDAPVSMGILARGRTLSLLKKDWERRERGLKKMMPKRA